MSARRYWQWASFTRGGGAKLMIVALSAAFALVGSPRLHECIHRHSARPAHSCTVLLRNTKGVKAIEDRARRPVGRMPTVTLAAPRVALIPVWVAKLFLEACRRERGPPALS